MFHFTLPALVLLALAQPAMPPELRTMVEAERAFARRSEELGMRAAFLEYLADDAIVFRPGPVNGRVWHAENPDARGVLSWRPAFAELSAAGDLGYTTGPYTLTPEGAGATGATRHGHYVTVWRKDAAVGWRVAIDHGIEHQPWSDSVDAVHFLSPARPILESGDASQETLLAADHELSRLGAEQGFTEALLAQAADALRVYRPGRFPASGHAAARELLSRSPTPGRFAPEGAGLSKASELGFTYGGGELAPGGESPPRAFTYLRIWRREPNGWRVILDLITF